MQPCHTELERDESAPLQRPEIGLCACTWRDSDVICMKCIQNLNDLQAGCFILHNGKEGECRERKRGSVQSTSHSFSQAPVFL